MGSFKNVIDKIVKTLHDDASLNAYISAEFIKSLTIKKSFNKRAEVNVSDLPIIFITRPSLEKSFLVNSIRNNKNMVRLYAGFQQQDKRKALDNFIEFEEKIDNALVSVDPETLGAMIIAPKASLNDEGMYHPVYFMVMEVEIQFRR